MGNTREGYLKRQKTLIAKYGSEEEYRKNLSQWGKKGLEKSKAGFHNMTKEQLRELQLKSVEARKNVKTV